MSDVFGKGPEPVSPLARRERPGESVKGSGFRVDFDQATGGLVLTLAPDLAHHREALLQAVGDEFYLLPLNEAMRRRIGEFIAEWLAEQTG